MHSTSQNEFKSLCFLIVKPLSVFKVTCFSFKQKQCIFGNIDHTSCSLEMYVCDCISVVVLFVLYIPYSLKYIYIVCLLYKKSVSPKSLVV